MAYISDVKYYNVQDVISLHQLSLLNKYTSFPVTGTSSAHDWLGGKI